MQLYMSRYIISFFGFIFTSLILFLIFSSTPVLTLSIDVVFILSKRTDILQQISMPGPVYANIVFHSTFVTTCM